AEVAQQFLQDPNFPQSQKDAWKMLNSSMTMQDTGWPADLVKTYKEIIISYLAQLTTPDAAASAVAGDIVNFDKEVLVNTDSSYSFAVRRASIVGLQGFQSAPARLALSQAMDELNRKLEAGGAEASPEDQEILLAIKKILLQDGYYKATLN
ncbi:MAG: hypothetical protein ABIR96_11745, partial [Bdellovibrionota bacterium]